MFYYSFHYSHTKVHYEPLQFAWFVLSFLFDSLASYSFRIMNFFIYFILSSYVHWFKSW
jgi:hypothetical protein